MKNDDTHRALSKRVGWAVAAIVLTYVVMASGIALTRNPWVDEAWFAGPGINLVANGHMGTSVMETEVKGSAFSPFVPLRMEKRTYWHPPLYFLAQAGWYELFGAGLFSMRSLSIAWGAIALVATFWLVRLLTASDAVSLLAITLSGTDFLFFNSAAVGRMDMMSVALALSAYVAYLGLRERSLVWAVLLGHTLVAGSGMTHGNGVLALAGMLFLNFAYDYRRINVRLVLVAAIPYVLGGIGWGLYILRDYEAFVTQFGTTLKSYPPSTSIVESLRQVAGYQYLAPYGFSSEGTAISKLKILIPCAYIGGMLGVIASPLRREQGVRTLIVLLALYVLMMTFGIGHKTWSYAVWVIPFYTALFALWYIRCWRTEVVRRSVLCVLLGGLVALQAAICVNQIVKDPYRKVYLPAMDKARMLDDGSGFIMGSAEIAFRLGFSERVVDDPNLGFVTGKQPAIIVMNNYYWGRIESLRESDDAGLYHYMIDCVGQTFEKVFDNGSYRVYAKRPGAAPCVGTKRG